MCLLHNTVIILLLTILIGYVCWLMYITSAHKRIFQDNFAMHLSEISDLDGPKGDWIYDIIPASGYFTWLSFRSEHFPILKHPELYHDIPCDGRNHFFTLEGVSIPSHLSTSELELWHAQLQCKEGKTNIWINANGEEIYDQSKIVYDPQHQKARIEITSTIN